MPRRPAGGTLSIRGPGLVPANAGGVEVPGEAGERPDGHYLTGIPVPLWPHLVLGQWVHVDKGTSFGQGRYVVLADAPCGDQASPASSSSATLKARQTKSGPPSYEPAASTVRVSRTRYEA